MKTYQEIFDAVPEIGTLHLAALAIAGQPDAGSRFFRTIVPVLDKTIGPYRDGSEYKEHWLDSADAYHVALDGLRVAAGLPAVEGWKS
jgi:hypothetical protein